MPRSPFWFTVVLLLAGLFLLRESRRADGALAEVDQRFLDWLMANAGSPAREAQLPPPAVVLVGIDDAALADRGAKEGTRGRELSALDYALFLQAADSLGAAVVGVEPVLAWPRERQQPEYERILLNQALRTPKLVLGTHAAEIAVANVATPRRTLAEAEDAESGRRTLSPLLVPGGLLPNAAAGRIVPPLRRVRGDATGLPELPDLARRPAERLLLAGTPGPTDLPPAPAGGPADGITRTVPLLFRSRGDVLPSFVLQTLMLSMQLTPDEVQVELGQFVQMGTRLRIPVDPAGAMRVDFPSGRRLPQLALDDWLLAAGGGAGRSSPAPPPVVRGGTVLLGRTDHAARTLRLPTGQDGSAVELFAVALATVGRRAFITRVPAVYDGLVIAALAVLGWGFLPLKRNVALTLTGAFFLVYTLLTLTVFELGRLWLPWALPAGMLATMAALLAVGEGRMTNDE